MLNFFSFPEMSVWLPPLKATGVTILIFLFFYVISKILDDGNLNKLVKNEIIIGNLHSRLEVLSALTTEKNALLETLIKNRPKALPTKEASRFARVQQEAREVILSLRKH